MDNLINARLALKSLFQTILEEETPAQKRAGDILQSDEADTDVEKLSPAQKAKLQGAVNIRKAMVKGEGGGNPSGRMSGEGSSESSEGNPLKGSKGTDRRRKGVR